MIVFFCCNGSLASVSQSTYFKHTHTHTHCTQPPLSRTLSLHLSVSRYLSRSVTHSLTSIAAEQLGAVLEILGMVCLCFSVSYFVSLLPPKPWVSLCLSASVWSVWMNDTHFERWLIICSYVLWQVVGQDELEELIADMTDEQVLPPIYHIFMDIQ